MNLVPFGAWRRWIMPMNASARHSKESIMLHEPAAPSGADPAAASKSRLGIRMFACYLIFYVLFVAINVSHPTLMERTVWRGLNLATVYGFALIIIALLQALAYDALCRKHERNMKGTQPEGKR
jgi:uncharacterized membrane protein (DUF485 family)